MKSLTWNQVNAWRLAQHSLSPRSNREAFVEVASHLYGIHAQVMSAAELALGARIDRLKREDVQAVLWEERKLVKTWAMRGTLHLLAAQDLPLHAAARTIDPRRWIDFESHGISEKQSQAFLEAVPEILSSEPMTREQLADALAEQVGLPVLSELIRSKWGTALKPSAFRGDLCFGPNQGKNVTFVNPKKWLASWKPAKPEAAFTEIARRFLRAYGPLTPKQFARWWNEGNVTVAKNLFKQIEDELEPVEVEGWRALALKSTIEQMQQSKVSSMVRLLPMFDAYVLDIARIGEPVLPKQYRKRVFRQQGWTTAVVLVDGIIEGVWNHKTNETEMTITVEMFKPPTEQVREGIAAEAARLGKFLDSEVTLIYDSIH
ncbi:winged helix DNA-binding domain-containing protein [bacterium]|nr:winged helix DNA-binding domain-containing protein [bacterium]